MFNVPLQKCTHQNLATTFCSQKDCTSNCLICDDQSCSCKQQHNKCCNFMLLRPILAKITKKIHLSNQPLQFTLELYNSLIKQLEVAKSQLISEINEMSGKRLTWVQNKVIESIYNQSGEIITGHLMNDFLKQLNDSWDISQQIQETKTYVSQIQQKVKEQLQKLYKCNKKEAPMVFTMKNQEVVEKTTIYQTKPKTQYELFVQNLQIEAFRTQYNWEVALNRAPSQQEAMSLVYLNVTNVDKKHIKTISLYFPNIQLLTLNRNADDSVIPQIIKNLKKLIKIVLKNCKITNFAVYQMARYLTSLKQIQIQNCPNITKDLRQNIINNIRKMQVTIY